MHVLECYDLLSPQITNGLFHFAFEERKEGKKNREKKKANIQRKIKKENNTVHQMLINCFNQIERKGEKKGKEDR